MLQYCKNDSLYKAFMLRCRMAGETINRPLTPLRDGSRVWSRKPNP